MINIKVEIDNSFLNFFIKNKNNYSEGWGSFCERNDIAYLKKYNFVDGDGLSEEDLKSLQITKEYLKENLLESQKHINKFFPSVCTEIEYPLKVSLIPNGRKNFSPVDNLQLFSIYPDAHPYETYLFLIHVYYHEITVLNYTDECKRISSHRNTSDDFKYWILLLIQNEGIGNFAVLNELEDFKKRNPQYTFKYFNYANDINNELKVNQSFGLLRQILNDMDNIIEFPDKMNLILKNKKLPIINLVGTHMAKRIEKEFGLDTLINVYQKSPINFFNHYYSTNDLLKESLFKGNTYLLNQINKVREETV